jgi:hypothetical protein
VSEANKSAHKHAQSTTTVVSEERAVNKVEEKEEQIEPPPISNFSSGKEVSTKAHSFVTIPLETQLESQVSSFQCLEESSYVEIFKDSCTQDHNSRNHVPKKTFQSKLLGYIRWRNILSERYQVFKKKGWKGLAGNPWDREGAVFFLFYFSAMHF